MSVLVSPTVAEALSAAAAARRPVVRRRARRAVVALVLLAGLAGVPLPARSAFQSLQEETDELTAAIETAEAEELSLSRWDREGHGALQRRALLWLTHEDVLELRNELLTAAHGCGLEVAFIDIAEGLKPLENTEDGEQGSTVLDMTGQEDDEALDELEVSGEYDDESNGIAALEPVTAVRFVLKGTGPTSSFLIFAGLMPHLPHPMRLRSAQLSLEETTMSFAMQVDKLMGPQSAMAALNGVWHP